MPADTPPSLEDLARAAVEAWDKWCDTSGSANREHSAFVARMVLLKAALESPTPFAAGAYMTPGERTQVELRFACALLVHGYPTIDREAQIVIDKARRLARLLLDPPAA